MQRRQLLHSYSPIGSLTAHTTPAPGKKKFVVCGVEVKVEVRLPLRPMPKEAPERSMADAGSGERINRPRQRCSARASSAGRAPFPPRFINRLQKRLPPYLHKHLHAGAREREGFGRLRPPQPSNHAVVARDRARSAQASPSTEPSEGNEVAHNEKGSRMRNPCVTSLVTVTLDEALSYLDAADGDELGAAFTLAHDRNRLDGSAVPPDETEVHHALFLLRRVRGLEAPSFDLMRIQLRERAA